MAGCEKLQKRLWLLALDDLSGPDREAMDEHVRRCEACREELGRLKLWLGEVQREGKVRLPPKEAAALRASVLAGFPSGSRKGPWWRRHRVRVLRLAPVAAALVVAVALVLPGLRERPSRPPSSVQVKVRAERSYELESGEVKDSEVIRNLDFLQDFETVEKLIRVVDRQEVGRFEFDYRIYVQKTVGHGQRSA